MPQNCRIPKSTTCAIIISLDDRLSDYCWINIPPITKTNEMIENSIFVHFLKIEPNQIKTAVLSNVWKNGESKKRNSENLSDNFRYLPEVFIKTHQNIELKSIQDTLIWKSRVHFSARPVALTRWTVFTNFGRTSKSIPIMYEGKNQGD